MKKLIKNEKGVSTLVATLLVTSLLMVMALIIVPYTVYIVKLNNIRTAAQHALREVETTGYLTTGSNSIDEELRTNLDKLGMPSVVKGGITYPLTVDSTSSRVLRTNADPTVYLAIKYPASNLQRMLTALGGSNTADDGYFYVKLAGRSEAYN